MTRQRQFRPRGTKTTLGLALTAQLGHTTPYHWCFAIYDGQERTALDAIARLISCGFLHESFEKKSFASGKPNRILYLTKTGRDWLVHQSKANISEFDVRYYWPGDEKTKPTYRLHEIEVRNVLITFQKHLRETKDGDMWIKPKTLRLNPAEATPLSTGALLPDSVFAIQCGRQVVQLYVELDKSTEIAPSIWKSKIERYLQSPEIMNSPATSVLVVTDSPDRMYQLMEWTNQVDQVGAEKFLFSDLDHVSFRYERRDMKLTLVSSGDPLGPVWRRIGGDEPHYLFEPG